MTVRSFNSMLSLVFLQEKLPHIAFLHLLYSANLFLRMTEESFYPIIRALQALIGRTVSMRNRQWTALAPFIGILLACALASPPSPAMAEPLNAQEVEAWSDATFGAAFAAHRFSGLVISVVQNDRVLFTKGYGFADYAARTPVDPARTRFRIGSISKTFTATAIAQLLDAGKIQSVDDPAKRYLRRVPLTGATADITLRDLLTHRGGFDSSSFGLATKQSFPSPLPLAELHRNSRPLVRQTGTLSVYSNYEIGLLGQVVQEITGISASDYFERHIFSPLQMRSTVLNEQLTPSQDLGVPYAFFPNGEAQQIPFLAVHPLYQPAGAIETTAQDMSKYLLANIAEGRPQSDILSVAGYEQLHHRTVGNHPATSGFGMSFLTLDWNAMHFIGHGGDWPGFHSILLFSPQAKVGFFISCMCEYPQGSLLEQITGSGRFRAAPTQRVGEPLSNVGIAQAFLTRFWGIRHPQFVPAGMDLSKFEGSYWHEDRNHTSVEKLLELSGGPASLVVVERDGPLHLKINGIGHYAAVGPGVFWNPSAEPTLSESFENSGLWAFSTDASGVAQVASPTWGLDPYVRAQGYANPRHVAQLAGFVILIELSGLLALFWPATRRSETVAKVLPLLSVCTTIGIPALLFLGYAEGDGLSYALLSGNSARFHWAIVLANSTAILGSAMGVLCVVAWCRGYWGAGARGVSRRVHYTVLALAIHGLIYAAAFFNLLGFHLPHGS